MKKKKGTAPDAHVFMNASTYLDEVNMRTHWSTAVSTASDDISNRIRVSLLLEINSIMQNVPISLATLFFFSVFCRLALTRSRIPESTMTFSNLSNMQHISVTQHDRSFFSFGLIHNSLAPFRWQWSARQIYNWQIKGYAVSIDISPEHFFIFINKQTHFELFFFSFSTAPAIVACF